MSSDIAQFTQQLESMMQSLKAAYPDCAKVRMVEQEFKLFKFGTPDKIIALWDKYMSKYYEACALRDVEALIKSRIPILERLDFAGKISDPKLDEESRRNLWEYIDLLSLMSMRHFKHNEMYKWYYDTVNPRPDERRQSDDGAIDVDTGDPQPNVSLDELIRMDPTGMLSQIPRSIAEAIMNQISQMDLDSFDPNDPQSLQMIAEVNNRALETIPQDEIERLATQLQPSAIATVEKFTQQYPNMFPK